VRRALVAFALALGCSRTPATKDEWRDVAGASDFAEPGATTILLEVRRNGGSGCGGGGCSSTLGARALGLLPSKSFGYFYPDSPRTPAARACPAAEDLGALFEDWTPIAIAPARRGEGYAPSCGLTTSSDGSMKYWVILRIGKPS